LNRVDGNAPDNRRRIKIDSKKLALRIARIAFSKKAEDLIVLKMGRVSNFCDFFVILNGTSGRHIRAISEAIEEELLKEGVKPVASGQSREESGWVLLDFLTVIVHIFTKPTREFYSLERLWQDAPILKLPKKIK
jgi:ribosome-associated protein